MTATINHDLRRDGPLRGIYGGLTQRPDNPSDPASLNHPVAIVRRRDGQDVALHLTDPTLRQRWTDESPRRGEAVGAYLDPHSGRPDVVVQRLDYLDGGADDDGGAARRADEGALLKLATARYSRDHCGADGRAMSAPAAAPAAPQLSSPRSAGVVDVRFHGRLDFIDGLAQGVSLSRTVDAADDPYQRQLAELERRHGRGTPGQRLLGGRSH
ncbi:MAG: hypothetical protein WBU92_01425 [Candidatus Dormiibacterota bacterium]